MSIENSAFHAGTVIKTDESIRIIEIDLSNAIYLQSIGSSAFYSQGGSTYEVLGGTLYIPDGVTSIGSNGFNGLDGLAGDLILPDSIESIGNSAFKGCGFDGTLKLPINSKYITVNESVFQNTKIKSLKNGIPNNIKILENYALSSSELTGSIVIPEGATKLGSAFRDTKIESLILPSTITYIGTQFISNCKQLEWVKLNFNFNNTITMSGSTFMNNGDNAATLNVIVKDAESYNYLYPKTPESRRKYLTYPLTVS